MKKKLTVPAVALRAKTIFPGAVEHFDITRKKSIAAIEKAMTGDEKVFLVTQKNPNELDPQKEGLYEYGTYCIIRQLIKAPQNMVRVMVEGLTKCRILSLDQSGEYLLAEVQEESAQSEIKDPEKTEAILRSIKELLSSYASTNRLFAEKFSTDFNEIREMKVMLQRIKTDIPWDYQIAQRLLECSSQEKTCDIILEELAREIQIEKIKLDFQMQIRESIDKNQKEYILREQMKLFRKNLGKQIRFRKRKNMKKNVRN